MPKKLLFVQDVIRSDYFVDMPMSARVLFFHLGMEAKPFVINTPDCDSPCGILNNPKAIARSADCSEDDLNILTEKGFLSEGQNGDYIVHYDPIYERNCKSPFSQLGKRMGEAIAQMCDVLSEAVSEDE